MRVLPALLATAASVLAGCSSSPRGDVVPTTSTPTTAEPATTSTTAAPKPTTTTVYAPTTPQTSADAAAGALVNFWSENNRSAAAGVASPAAVAALFAGPFPGQYIQERGCSAPADGPTTCTYANRNTGSLYELFATQGPAGWYISSVTVES